MIEMNPSLKKYIPIADMIATTFGQNCEVVIHDLSIPQNSVVYAVHSHVTGRKVGQSFDHLIKQVLLSKNFKKDYVANYSTDQKHIKSSTAFIRNHSNEVIGALCINFNMEPFKNVQNILNDLCSVQQEPIKKDVKPFDHVMEIVDDLIENIISNVEYRTLKKKDKIALIQFMEQKGIFLMKGAIEKVAKRLNISKVTVYSYLDTIKKKED